MFAVDNAALTCHQQPGRKHRRRRLEPLRPAEPHDFAMRPRESTGHGAELKDS